MAVNMKAVGTTINEKVKDSNDSQTVIHIVDNSKMAYLMDKEFTIGAMEKLMMVSGSKA